MNWIKWVFYVLIYGLLFIAFFPLIQNLGYSLTDIYTGATKLVGELHIITSLMVEATMVVVIGILFFLPIGGADGRLNSSLNYFIESVSESIKKLGNTTNIDKEARTAMYISLIYSILILFIITFIYFALILKTKSITNGLELIYYGLFIFILINIVNFVSSIIAKLDDDEKNGRGNGSVGFLEKKNLLTFGLIIGLLIFLGFGTNITGGLYNKTKETPPFSILDGTRISSENR